MADSVRLQEFHILFIHLSIGGTLGCFHLLAIMNNIADLFPVVFLCRPIFIFLEYIPRSGIAGSDVNSMLII